MDNGGCWFCGDWFEMWSSSGNGGVAGEGGNIIKSENAKIYAYNGDMITNNDYNNIYEYDKDGNKTSNILTTITRKDGKEIIPSKIFAQDGIRRAVYDNVCYMPAEKKKKYNVDGTIDNSRIKNVSPNGKIQNVRIIDEETIQSYGQGIGSGAGYIELSNGSYEVDSNLN